MNYEETKSEIRQLIPDQKKGRISANDVYQSFEKTIDAVDAEAKKQIQDFDTYAKMIVTDGVAGVIYRVSNDPDPLKNGYYHWDGVEYVKDAELIAGDVASGEVEAVTGGVIYDSIKRLSQEAKLVWFINSGDFRGELTESYNSGTDELTIAWTQPLLLIMGNYKYIIIPAGSIILSGGLSFAYIDYAYSGSFGSLTAGDWNDGTLLENPSKNVFRVVLFIRGAYSDKLEYSLLSKSYLEADFSEVKTKADSSYDSLIGKYTEFPLAGVWLNDETFGASSNWGTQAVECSEGDVIIYKLYSTSTAALLTFLDSGGGVISQILQSGSGTEVPQEGSAIAPANTASVQASTFGTKINLSYVGLFIKNIADKVIALESSVASAGKTIVVDKNLVEDAGNYIFNTIAAALAVATGIDTVKIYGEEAIPYEEYSLHLPDGITLIGIGTPKIQGELAVSESVTNILNWSTIDANQSCTLENLIVTAKNMRYPIHADFSSGNTVKNIKNCKFIHYGNEEAYAYHLANVGDELSIVRAMSAWGGGTKAGDRVYIDGCYFESVFRAFSTHNNVDFDLNYGASIVKVSNSEFVSHGIDRDGSDLTFFSSMHVQHLDSNTNDQIILDNVKMNGFITNQLSGTYLSQEVIMNSLNQKQVWNNAGSSYSIAEQWANLDVTWYAKIKGEISSFKNVNAGTLTRGKAVKRSGLGIDLFTSSDNVSDFLGILMQDVEAGKSADVKFKGYLPVKYFTGSLTIAEGADISVDASGNFVQTSAFVVANAVDNSNILISE